MRINNVSFTVEKTSSIKPLIDNTKPKELEQEQVQE